MTVAFDKADISGASTGELTVNHTPNADPQGVLALIAQVDSDGSGGSDSVNVVTYGSLTLVEVALSPVLKTATEASGVHAFFAAIPNHPRLER